MFISRILKIVLLIVSVSVGTQSDSVMDNRMVIAVLELDNYTKFEDPRIGRGVTDMLITELLNTGRCRLVERNDDALKSIINEQALGLSGLVDAHTAAKVGKMIGARGIVIGIVSDFGIRKMNTFLGIGGKKTITTRIVIDARLIDTETSEIVAAKTGIGEFTTETKGAVLTFEFGTEGFDETAIGISTRKALRMIAKHFSVYFEKRRN